MQEIPSFIRTNYLKYMSNFTKELEALVLDDPVVPAVPDPANQVSFELWMTEF